MLASLWCLASASPWACNGDAPQALWQLGRLDVDGARSQVEQDVVRELTLLRLAQTPQLHLPDTRQRTLRARVTLPTVRLRLHLMGGGLQLSLQPMDSFGPEFEALVPLSEDTDGAHALDDGLADALAAVVAMAGADRAGREALRQLIADGAAAGPGARWAPLTAHGRYNLQAFAVRRVAQLRDFAAGPLLRRLVERAAELDAPVPQQALGLQAVGSLVALCDQQAVLPMIALARHKGPEVVVQMAHAIATVGGPMAEAYLVTLASGHLDHEVRQQAGLALMALSRRKGTGRVCG